MELPWTQLCFLLGIVAAWSLVIIATTRFTLARSFQHYDDKIQAQEKAAQRLATELLEMKADLPLNYLRKEDFIRHEVVINTKLDRLGDQIAYIREKLK